MAAWGAATVRERALRVAVLEKMPRPARKLMLTGKGRCNFTNAKDWEAFQPHIHPNPRFLRPAFFNLPPEKLRKLLADNGLPSVVERGDRVFPASRQAVDVVDCLERMVRQAGVEVGMNDPYHFSKTFKNIVGMSPSAYSKTASK